MMMFSDTEITENIYYYYYIRGLSFPIHSKGDPKRGRTKGRLDTTIGNGDPMHRAQDPPADTTAHGNSKRRKKKMGKRRQHTVQRRRIPERSKKARRKDVPGLTSDSGPRARRVVKP